MRNANRYADGYLPKIAYHSVNGNDDKVKYFMKRQEETYGPMDLDSWKTLAKLCAEMM